MDVKQATAASQQANRSTHRCVACGHDRMFSFFSIRAVPVFCNVLHDTRKQAIAAARGDIELVFCPSCHLIHNVLFDPDRMHYDGHYENSLHFSHDFNRYADELASGLVQRYRLRGKEIVEIGCGDGDFLAHLWRQGENRCVGFDPAHRQERCPVQACETFRIEPQMYTGEKGHLHPDLLCCRHVLEHVDRPLEFLRGIRQGIARNSGTAVFFEVPNALYTIRDQGVWDIIYEHCSYFTPHAIARLFEEASFKPVEVAQAYGGQFITIDARPARTRPARAQGDNDTIVCVHNFQRAYQDKLQVWGDRLAGLESHNTRAVVWGAGSKGTTFMNVLNVGLDVIPYVVDINPRKWGKFTAGTGQQIVSPEFLRQYHPQVVVIMNPIYRREIERTLTELGITAELLLA